MQTRIQYHELTRVLGHRLRLARKMEVCKAQSKSRRRVADATSKLPAKALMEVGLRAVTLGCTQRRSGPCSAADAAYLQGRMTGGSLQFEAKSETIILPQAWSISRLEQQGCRRHIKPWSGKPKGAYVWDRLCIFLVTDDVQGRILQRCGSGMCQPATGSD